ncbi:hypothetical protein [Azovibrio restrictus]|uniref:hypothetical protein n=1 Tax=Azovibrio restrictus TaxID=146938 RepID=UPI0026F33973|nr:hypothetical protein [Azovibrio restrictus]
MERGKRLRSILVGLGAWVMAAGQVAAGETGEAMRLAPALAAPEPQVLRPGQCVRYEEGGAGFLGRTPLFWLEGEVVAFRREQRPWVLCPASWRAGGAPRDREDLLERERLLPCFLADEAPAATLDVAWVRLQPRRWETPWARSWASRGRLYRGMYLDQPLQPGIELEIDARLLVPCRPAD